MDTLENESLQIDLSPFAASVHRVWSKKLGRMLNFALSKEEAHLTDPSYSGNTLGAYAGRVRNASLSISGKEYRLSANDGRNSLHGGLCSLRKLWRTLGKNKGHVIYETELGHLEDGLPGKRRFRAGYLLRGDELLITLYGESDRPTFLNLSNHLYWRIGEGSELEDRLTVRAGYAFADDEEFLPSGIVPVQSPLSLQPVPDKLNNAFALEGPLTLESKDIRVTMRTEAPYAVIYSGFYLPEPAIAIEPQNHLLLTGSIEGMLTCSLSISYQLEAF